MDRDWQDIGIAQLISETEQRHQQMARAVEAHRQREGVPDYPELRRLEAEIELEAGG